MTMKYPAAYTLSLPIGAFLLPALPYEPTAYSPSLCPYPEDLPPALP